VTVLLTGAGGFVGSHVLEALLAASFDVTCVDSFRHNGASDRIAAVLEDGVSSRVEVVIHDLIVPFSRRQLALLDGVTDVVHVASRCQVEESIQEPDDFILNNVAGTVRTLELARELNAHVIQMSTDEVFGERGRHARSAVGMGSLPNNIPVEIEVIVEVGGGAPAKKKPTQKKK